MTSNYKPRLLLLEWSKALVLLGENIDLRIFNLFIYY